MEPARETRAVDTREEINEGHQLVSTGPHCPAESGGAVGRTSENGAAVQQQGSSLGSFDSRFPVRDSQDFYLENDPREKVLRDAIYRAMANLSGRPPGPEPHEAEEPHRAALTPAP